MHEAPVRDFNLVLEDELNDLFDLATSPFENLDFPNGLTLRLVVELASDDHSPVPDLFAMKSNAFWIEISDGHGRVVGADRAAIIFALDWLAEITKRNDCRLPIGQVSDWAELDIRALHFVLRRVSLDVAVTLVDRARQARFNTIIVSLADAVNIRPDIVPLRADAMTKAEFQSFVAYARANGMNVIPGLPLLTHQQSFLKNRFPELMYNYSTYDPREPAVYELVFEYIDELIETMNPGAIHIGHDEIKGLTPASRRNRKWMKEGEQPLPPDLFLQDVITLNDYLVARDVDVWMWGDMLISANEFPEMHKKNFHGIQGYNELRNQIPKNIIIADWHYHHETKDFPSAKAFADAGHDVVGASWKNMNNIRLFAEYMADMGIKGRGMIAGTFFHVQRREWGIVNPIIDESGHRYWVAGRE